MRSVRQGCAHGAPKSGCVVRRCPVHVPPHAQSSRWLCTRCLQFHSASARELRRIAMESLEALFGLQLPLPPNTVRQYMQGIAGMMTRCGKPLCCSACIQSACSRGAHNMPAHNMPLCCFACGRTLAISAEAASQACSFGWKRRVAGALRTAGRRFLMLC